MIDINLIRNNRSLVEDNLKKKFQENKITILNEIVDLDKKVRELKITGDKLRQERNTTSDEIGILFKDKKVDEANKKKEQVKEINDKLIKIEEEENELSTKLKEKMMIIPNIIADDVPIGKEDTENVEEARYGEPIVPEYDIP